MYEGRADLAVRRAEPGADRLLQDQADTEGREQRLQRTPVEKADDAALDGDADRPGRQEGERDGDRQRPVEEMRRMVPDHLLHHEGRVGADHDHLAMRHVDDAHDAEGDGESDRSEQQDRAQRQAEPEGPRGGDDLLLALDVGDSLVEEHFERPRASALSCFRSARPSGVMRPDSVWAACTLSASDVSLLVSTIAARASAKAFLTLGSVSLASASLECGEGGRIAAAEDGIRGLQTPRGVRRHQRERSDSGGDDAAQAIVEPDRFAAAGGLGAGGGIEDFPGGVR